MQVRYSVAMTTNPTTCLPLHSIAEQVALLSQKGRAMLRVC